MTILGVRDEESNFLAGREGGGGRWAGQDIIAGGGHR
jgi:hypothetical protein